MSITFLDILHLLSDSDRERMEKLAAQLLDEEFRHLREKDTQIPSISTKHDV